MLRLKSEIIKLAITTTLLCGMLASHAQESAFEHTVQLIKNKVSCCSVPFAASGKRKVDSIAVAQNGDITLFYSDKKQKQNFNIFKLYKEEQGATGIDTILGGKFIQFTVSSTTTRLIRFAAAKDAEEVYTAFLSLLRIPAEGMHFVSRNSLLQTQNSMLAKSISSVDTRDEGKTAFSISGKGEGWLDKDSMPVGLWRFYSKDQTGAEYLFKSGTYRRTTTGMFEVKGIDSTDLKRHYGLTYYNLKQDQLQIVPFIKSGKWNYYDSSGKLWKTVNFNDNKIPINVQIVLAGPDNTDATRLVVALKDNMDEWTDGE